MKTIQMVDLSGQYKKIKEEIDASILDCLASAKFIQGPIVEEFENNLAAYLAVKNVISCANGTDALQISLMALELKSRDEIIIPAFTYVATAEVVALLGLRPVMVDVDPETFNVNAAQIEKAITSRTKAIVPVHLFGQSCDMQSIMEIAQKHNLYVIEDNAQAIGADYEYRGEKKKTGTVGHIGCTSFFPSKNLGCFGDGGAIFTNDDDFATRIRMIANHGQAKKYYHAVIGVNSRLDTIQAAVLDVKLTHLDDYCKARHGIAGRYNAAFTGLDMLETPGREKKSTHVYHQYTIKVKNGHREALRKYLDENGIPSMIYYPLPLYRQEAFKSFAAPDFVLPVTERLCESVLSLPIHTEMDSDTQDYIIENIERYFTRELHTVAQ